MKKARTTTKDDSRLIKISGNSLTPEAIRRFIQDKKANVVLEKKALDAVRKSAAFLEREALTRPIYGVNTGFGPMVTHIIGTKQLSELQYNLIRGHAVGAGDPIRSDDVLSAMIVRLNTLARGHSGVSMELIETLAILINNRVAPIVPTHGAVGTSGDLVQLAHIALAIIGEGEAQYRDAVLPVRDIMKKIGVEPHVLRPKEGLALINGTSMMTGVGTLVVLDAERIVNMQVRSGALALELVHGISDLLDPVLHKARPHAGQIHVARQMRSLLVDSKLLTDRSVRSGKVNLGEKTHVTDVHLQDVYSFRCIPQIVGPLLESIQRAKKVLETEINATTDNPIVDVTHKRFLHGGNFHGEYVAVAMDHTKTALTKLSMLSERRINFFLNRAVNQTFSPFLNLKQPGFNMGLQGLQFVATSTAAHSQSLSFPHSIHSIPTNADNQDVVSMGCDAALIAETVVDNAYIVLAIELITLAQAVDATGVRGKLSSASRALFKTVRRIVSAITDDRPLNGDLEDLISSLKKGVFDTITG